MEEKYLVVNAGSSSLKFSLYAMPKYRVVVSGIVEKIGEGDSFYTIKVDGKKNVTEKVIKNHAEAVDAVFEELLESGIINSYDEIKAVGHRIVHGGEKYSDSVLITDEVIDDIKELTKFASLHHPGNLLGIEAIKKFLPEVPMVAVFDTSFHQTIPEVNYLYPVNEKWHSEYGVRKYGFHGTSHKYITEFMKKMSRREDPNLIICHIGSGASISAIKDGKCYDTSMGLTPLSGLMMGTRSGDIDPFIPQYMANVLNKPIEDINDLLNLESGLLAVGGKNDYRDLETLALKGDKKAILALEMFKKSIEKYIAEYYVLLNGKIDALIFTAGIGENAIKLRREIIEDLGCLGIYLDYAENENIAGNREYRDGLITTPESNFPVLVIPTNEELMILKDTYNITKCKKNEKIKINNK